MKEEETGEWRRRHHIVDICWFYMVVCIPFLVTTPQSSPLGTRSLLNLWNSSGADIIPRRVLLPHPACKPERWHVNQARLIRPVLKYFLNSWKKFVLFCFKLRLLNDTGLLVIILALLLITCLKKKAIAEGRRIKEKASDNIN